MSDRKQDRRINRTKKLLLDALTSIMDKKRLKDISIRELCDYADISRGTFYLHYTDINNMVEKIENELLEGLKESLEKNIHTCIELCDVHHILLDIYQYLEHNSIIFEKLFGANGDVTLLNKVKDIVRDKCFDSSIKEFGDDSTPILYYLNSFIVSGIMGIITDWLSGGMKETPEDITKITVQVMKNWTDLAQINT